MKLELACAAIGVGLQIRVPVRPEQPVRREAGGARLPEARAAIEAINQWASKGNEKQLPPWCSEPNGTGSYGGCTTQCTYGPFCGDGIVNGPEECDSGDDAVSQRVEREVSLHDGLSHLDAHLSSETCTVARQRQRDRRGRPGCARYMHIVYMQDEDKNPCIMLTGRALLTDLYQLTMAQGYFATGLAEAESVFHLFFRKLPFGGGYAVACGLADVVEYLDGLSFEAADLNYLAGLVGSDDKPLFQPSFLEHLATLRWRLDVDAVPEGTLVFAHEPLVRVRGPLLQAQLVETALLNAINFQTLVATKAARVCAAAGDDPVLEFGLRRAQGQDGGICASRAAFVGGCAATSNVLAGKRYGIPVRGTHAHSWVMAFDDELQAFKAYAEAMPNNAVFLVDTYDSLEGVRNAIRVGRGLRDKGHPLGGIRLDSGDLAWLSIEARKLLDDAGFPDATIVASNDLDEFLIESLKQQGARIGVWGVGTKLVTAYDQPALGGVYKLSAIRRGDGGAFRDVVKISEQLVKISTPGIQQVRRYYDPRDGHFVADAIIDEDAPPQGAVTVVDVQDPLRHKPLTPGLPWEPLLVPVLRASQGVYQVPDTSAARARTLEQLKHLPPFSRRLQHPHEYPVGLEQGLADRRLALVKAAKQGERA